MRAFEAIQATADFSSCPELSDKSPLLVRSCGKAALSSPISDGDSVWAEERKWWIGAGRIDRRLLRLHVLSPDEILTSPDKRRGDFGLQLTRRGPSGRRLRLWLTKRHGSCCFTSRGGGVMNKDVTICFRTNKTLRQGLEMIAKKEKRSISAIIEKALANHLNESRELANKTEQRRFCRKQVSIPALVKSNSSFSSPLEGGVVLNLSLGGLCIAIPQESSLMTGDEGMESGFEAAFVVPEMSKPIRVLCRRQRIAAENGTIQIGATFVDADFVHYQRLQQYLLQ
jgi:hypothetical protein